MLFKHVGVRNYNDSHVLAILEALHVYCSTSVEELIVESESLKCHSKGDEPVEIRVLLKGDKIHSVIYSGVFYHAGQSASSMADGLSKQRVDRLCALELSLI